MTIECVGYTLMETIQLPLRRRLPKAAQAEPIADNRCLSRIAPFPHFDYFGNNKNRFYMEMRCDRLRVQGSEFCEACQQKDPTYHYPSSRRFDHGKINEPIPLHSHIYGGEWYKENVKRWGEPNSDAIVKALECQRAARDGYSVKENIVSSEENMSKRGGKKAKEPAVEDAPAPIVAPQAEVKVPKKRAKKKTEEPAPSLPLILQSDPPSPTEEKGLSMEDTIPPPVVVEPKKRKPAAKRAAKPLPTVVAAPIIPTTIAAKYKEVEMEEVAMADYDVVRVRVVPFRDSLWIEETKKKVYRRGGEYVGRYDPATDQMDEDVPDSDAEDT